MTKALISNTCRRLASVMSQSWVFNTVCRMHWHEQEASMGLNMGWAS